MKPDLAPEFKPIVPEKSFFALPLAPQKFVDDAQVRGVNLTSFHESLQTALSTNRCVVLGSNDFEHRINFKVNEVNFSSPEPLVLFLKGEDGGYVGAIRYEKRWQAFTASGANDPETPFRGFTNAIKCILENGKPVVFPVLPNTLDFALLSAPYAPVRLEGFKEHALHLCSFNSPFSLTKAIEIPPPLAALLGIKLEKKNPVTLVSNLSEIEAVLKANDPRNPFVVRVTTASGTVRALAVRYQDGGYTVQYLEGATSAANVSGVILKDSYQHAISQVALRFPGLKKGSPISKEGSNVSEVVVILGNNLENPSIALALAHLHHVAYGRTVQRGN
jgi:hypothetical protein